MWNDSQKLKNSKNCWCTPPQDEILRFLKMRCFVAKDGKSCELAIPSQSESHWGEKMEKDAKWPNWAFWANQSHFLANLPLCVILSCFSVKWFKKLKKYANVPPPHCRNKKFWDFSKMRHFGGIRWEKLWIRWNWPFQVNLSLILGERWKNLQMTKIGHLNQSKPLILAKSPLWVTLSHFGVKWLKKLKNSNICWCSTLPQEWNFLRFLQKWDTLVVKDGKSCESGEIGHSKSIWASFWGKRGKNLQNDQNWPFGANLSHFFAKFTISIEILLRYLSFHQFWS